MSTIYNLCLTSKRKLYASCPAFLFVLVPHLQTHKTLSATHTHLFHEKKLHTEKLSAFLLSLILLTVLRTWKRERGGWCINKCAWEGIEKYTAQTTQIQNQMGIQIHINNEERSKIKTTQKCFPDNFRPGMLVCLHMWECALLCPSG